MQKPPSWARCRQRDDDPGLLFDDGGGQLHEMQPQRVELGAAPRGSPWAGGAQFPPEPVGATVQHQAHLVAHDDEVARVLGYRPLNRPGFTGDL